MHALLVGVNGRYSHTNLALRYLRNEIRAAGHDAGILEFEITDRRQDMLEAIVLAGPQVLLLSVYVWNAAIVKALLPDIRSLLPDTALILGGPEVTYSARQWLHARPEIDLIVAGPAEEAVRRLAGADFAIPAERVLAVPNRPFAEIAFPYLEEDFAALDHRYIYYESSRGCPCSCSYCVSGRDDQRPQFRPLELALSELDRIVSAGRRLAAPPIVKFVDRTFNADPARACAIWRHLAQLEAEVTFHCEVHPAFLTEEHFEVFAAAPPGRLQFEIGVQSIHPRTLQGVQRAGAWSRSRPLVKRLIELGTVAVHLDLIVGLPYEGLAEIGASINDVIALKPDRFDIGFLKSLPGTTIRAQTEQNGQIAMQEAPYQVLANRWLSLGEIARLRRVQQLVDAVWNANRLESELDTLADRHGGYFNAFTALLNRAEAAGYNLATRRRHKVEAFVRGAA